jgi:predicted component of type VI protein secretion system
MNVRFVVIAPESKKGTFSIRLPIVVGRSEEVKFRIQQDRVSRKHCEFFGQDGVVFLRDLGSTNGTFLDDEQVPASGKTPIDSGAVVRVGGLAFRVEYDMPAGMQTTAVGEPKAKTSDDTIGLTQGGDSEPLHVEHATDTYAAAAATDGEDAGEAMFQEEVAEEPASEEAAAEQPPAEEAVAPAEPTPGESSSEHPKKQGKGFDFLSAGTPSEESAADAPQWPAGSDDAAEAPADDEKLGDFFKGLK